MLTRPSEAGEDKCEEPAGTGPRLPAPGASLRGREAPAARPCRTSRAAGASSARSGRAAEPAAAGSSSCHLHVRGARAFRVVLDVELHLVLLLQRLEACGSDGGKVDEDVLAAVVGQIGRAHV